MNEVAPDASLTSSANNWGIYNTYAVKCVIDGTPIDVDWCKGLVRRRGSDHRSEREAPLPKALLKRLPRLRRRLLTARCTCSTPPPSPLAARTLENLIANNADYAKYAAYVSDGYYHESELASAPVLRYRDRRHHDAGLIRKNDCGRFFGGACFLMVKDEASDV